MPIKEMDIVVIMRHQKVKKQRDVQVYQNMNMITLKFMLNHNKLLEVRMERQKTKMQK